MNAHGPNCFNAVQLHWKDSVQEEFVGPEQFILYVHKYFDQLSSTTSYQKGDVGIIWSRTSQELSHGNIRINELIQKKSGYPHGLVIEHAFVYLEDELIYHKLDPSPHSVCEIIPKALAIEPYRKKPGFELTLHRRKVVI